MNKKELKDKYLNKKVKFISGNFTGKSGECISVNENEDALYGIRLFVMTDGMQVCVEKSEHIEVYENDFMCEDCGEIITEEEWEMFGGKCEECNLQL